MTKPRCPGSSMAETTSRLELFLSSGSTPDTVEQYRAALNQLVEVPAAREASLEVLRSAAFEMLQEEQYKKVAYSLRTFGCLGYS